MPWAASPPSAFCHEKVQTSMRSQGMSMANTALVASHRVRPPLVVPFQVNTMS